MQNFLDYFSQSLLFRNFIEVLMGLDNTLLLLIISLPIGFILSLVFALGRVSKNKILSKSIAGYIFVIRGTPLLVQIYLIYFGLGASIASFIFFFLLGYLSVYFSKYAQSYKTWKYINIFIIGFMSLLTIYIVKETIFFFN